MRATSKVVFVVDDDLVIAKSLAVILSHAGFHALAFEQPQEAIEAAAQVAPDLLITDVMMPGMSGVALAIHFRMAHPLCKILLFSGHESTSHLLDARRARRYGFELLTKPVHPADLLAKVVV